MNYKPEEIGRFTYAITIILIVLLYLPQGVNRNMDCEEIMRQIQVNAHEVARLNKENEKLYKKWYDAAVQDAN